MKVDIYFQRITQKGGRHRYRWAWKESHDAKVYGLAISIGEIKNQAARMFPGCCLNLIAF